MASATEMPSTTVVAPSNNNNSGTTVARTASGSLDKDHKALKAEIFNRKTAPSPRHLSAHAVKTNRPAAQETASTSVNLATTRGSAAVHPSRTDGSRTASATTTTTKTSNTLTRSQQSRRIMKRLLMRTLKKGPLGIRQTTSTVYQALVLTSLHSMTHANWLEYQDRSTTITTHVYLLTLVHQ